MANAYGKTVDTTFLSPERALERGIIHRDYIAHCARWSHILKVLIADKRRDIRVLDVGCGREVPLARTIYTNKVSGKIDYMGVDAGPVDTAMFTGKWQPVVIENTDFLDVQDVFGYAPIQYITSFEVIEHVEPAHARAIMQRIYDLCSYETVVYISTPVWNGKAAANHVSEIGYDALGAMFEDIGFAIVDQFGTFASQTDYKRHLTPAETDIFDHARRYYDSNLISVLMAPLVPPRACRNVMWMLAKNANRDLPRQFPLLSTVDGPWTSSSLWPDLDGPVAR